MIKLGLGLKNLKKILTIIMKIKMFDYEPQNCFQLETKSRIFKQIRRKRAEHVF